MTKSPLLWSALSAVGVIALLELALRASGRKGVWNFLLWELPGWLQGVLIFAIVVGVPFALILRAGLKRVAEEDGRGREWASEVAPRGPAEVRRCIDERDDGALEFGYECSSCGFTGAVIRREQRQNCPRCDFEGTSFPARSRIMVRQPLEPHAVDVFARRRSSQRVLDCVVPLCATAALFYVAATGGAVWPCAVAAIGSVAALRRLATEKARGHALRRVGGNLEAEISAGRNVDLWLLTGGADALKERHHLLDAVVGQGLLTRRGAILEFARRPEDLPRFGWIVWVGVVYALTGLRSRRFVALPAVADPLELNDLLQTGSTVQQRFRAHLSAVPSGASPEPSPGDAGRESASVTPADHAGPAQDGPGLPEAARGLHRFEYPTGVAFLILVTGAAALAAYIREPPRFPLPGPPSRDCLEDPSHCLPSRGLLRPIPPSHEEALPGRCERGSADACLELANARWMSLRRWNEAPLAEVEANRPQIEEDLGQLERWARRGCEEGAGRACALALQGAVAAFLTTTSGWDESDAEREITAHIPLVHRGCTELTDVESCRLLFEVGDADDERAALEVATRLCAGGDPAACALRGRVLWYLEGEEPNPDVPELFEAGCEAGHTRACWWLGEWLREERPAQARRACELLQRAADSGEVPEALTGLAACYIDDTGFEENQAEALRILRRACERFDPSACSSLASLLEDEGDTPDEELRGLREVACRFSDPDGCHDLSYMQLRGRGGTRDERAARSSFARARPAYDDACSAGDHYTCWLVGVWLWANQPDEATQGCELIQRAALSGEVDEAYHDLADCFAFEAGLPQDRRQASRYYRMACQRGADGAACAHSAALRTELGDRHELALSTLRRVACQEQDLFGCGLFWADGLGGPRDEARAREMFRIACEAGNPSACYQVGSMAQTGSGGPVAREQAARWLAQACQGGVEAACDLPASLPESAPTQPARSR